MDGAPALVCHRCGRLDDDRVHAPPPARLFPFARPTVDLPLGDPVGVAISAAVPPSRAFQAEAEGVTLQTLARRDFVATWPSVFDPLGDLPTPSSAVSWLTRRDALPNDVAVARTSALAAFALTAQALAAWLSDARLLLPPAAPAACDPAGGSTTAGPTNNHDNTDDADSTAQPGAAPVISFGDDAPAPTAAPSAAALGASLARTRTAALGLLAAARSADQDAVTAWLIPEALAALPALLAAMSKEVQAAVGFKAVRTDPQRSRAVLDEPLLACVVAWAQATQRDAATVDLADAPALVRTLAVLFSVPFSWPASLDLSPPDLIRLAAQWVLLSAWAGSTGPTIHPSDTPGLADPARVGALIAWRSRVNASAAVLAVSAFGPSTVSHRDWRDVEASRFSITVVTQVPLAAPRAAKRPAASAVSRPAELSATADRVMHAISSLSPSSPRPVPSPTSADPVAAAASAVSAATGEPTSPRGKRRRRQPKSTAPASEVASVPASLPKTPSQTAAASAVAPTTTVASGPFRRAPDLASSAAPGAAAASSVPASSSAKSQKPKKK